MKQLIAALLFVSGCAHGPPCQFSLDPAFTAEERAAFEIAAEAWYEATDGHAAVTFDGEWPPAPLNDHIIRRVSPESLGGNCGMSYWTEAPIGERQPSWIAIAPDALYPDHAADLPWTIAHELGHHWNLRHSQDPNDVMYKQSGDRGITANDVARFCERQGCGDGH